MMNLAKYKDKIHWTDGSVCWCLPIIYYEPDVENVVFLHREFDWSRIEP